MSIGPPIAEPERTIARTEDSDRDRGITPPSGDRVDVEKLRSVAEVKPAAENARAGRPNDAAGSSRDSQPGRGFYRRQYIIAAIAAIAAVVAVGTLFWWISARQFETTDDAFIDARIVSISPEVNGAIVDVPVTDNQFVTAGSVLVRIDDRDFRAAFDQAKAAVDQANANLVNLKAQEDEQQAKVEQAEKQAAEDQAALRFSEEENARYQDLLRKGAGTVQRAQQAASDLGQKKASLAAAQANVVAAEKQINVLKTQQQVVGAQLEQAQASQEQAEINLSRTVVTAPVAGWATQISAAKGTYSQAGQSLMMFVPRELWVTANFKESELSDIHPGQEATIAVDAYPGRTFGGHVDSIQAGSGAAFSLLPPENATGNYVKVVQRVPVKIAFDKLPDEHLGPGMSVVPSVKVR